MKDIINNLAALIKVKTVVTFVLVAVFCVLAFRGSIDSQNVVTIVTTVIAFYFGTQKVKESDED